MALTAAGDQLTLLYRRQVLALRARTLRELAAMWPALDLTRLDKTFPAWASSVQAAVESGRGSQAQLAQAYLRAFRLAEGVTGAPVLVDPPALEVARLDTALRVTALVSAKQNSARGMALDEASRLAFVASSGAASRLALEAGRDVLIGSSAADPASGRWRRVASASACSFCRMLAGRDAVYSSREAASSVSGSRRNTRAAGSKFHDHCGCTVELVYG